MNSLTFLFLTLPLAGVYLHYFFLQKKVKYKEGHHNVRIFNRGNSAIQKYSAEKTGMDIRKIMTVKALVLTR